MELDRPHHRTNSNTNNSSTSNNATSELFICFTSRLSSSSSMKISSKSILSPGRCNSREPTSLSNSLSRRLRSNGSLKVSSGQASPMFPNRKKGCSFDNPEPSSPKVTCIGQVRVKTKKKHARKNLGHSRSLKRGEVSFRKVGLENIDNAGNEFASSNNGGVNNEHEKQKWVHFSICEALRAFGSELNCFLPCRSPCFSGDKGKEKGGGGDNGSRSGNGSSCGAVFARWLVAVQDGDNGGNKGREIELVVGHEAEEEEEEQEEDFTERRRSYRRHVFEEIEFSDEKFDNGDENEEAARVSICIPPKNALLLMRCISDPVKMAALSNKFWEPPIPNNGEVNENGDEDDNEVSSTVVNENKEVEEVEKNVEDGGDDNVRVDDLVRDVKSDEEMAECEDLVAEMEEKLVCCENDESELVVSLEQEEDDKGNEADDKESNLVQEEAETEIEETTLMADQWVSDEEGKETETEEQFKNQENVEIDDSLVQESEDMQENFEECLENASIDEEKLLHLSINQESEQCDQELELLEADEVLAVQELMVEEKETVGNDEQKQEETVTIQERSQPEPEPTGEDPKTRAEEVGIKSKEKESQQQSLLPDCLLLMMCEPKLSMEVSKETWVCSTDFIRWLPEPSRPVHLKRKDGGDQSRKKITGDSKNSNTNTSNNNGSNPPSAHGKLQPPRSSCSYPAKPPPRAAGAESMTTAIEKKLVGTKAYEPFVLKRCKSEPMKSAAKLASDACLWKNHKLEPHRPSATLGVGATGVV